MENIDKVLKVILFMVCTQKPMEKTKIPYNLFLCNDDTGTSPPIPVNMVNSRQRLDPFNSFAGVMVWLETQ